MITRPGTHYQHFYIKGSDGKPVPKMTVCYIRTETECFVGVSICSLKDNHNKSRGRKLAYGRAVAAQAGKELPITREEAKKVLSLCTLGEISFNRQTIKIIVSKSFKVDDPTYLVVKDLDNHTRKF